jgi:hypothetical protein
MSAEKEILLWDVYNVLDSDDYSCKSFFKNGKLCNRNCSMKYNSEENSGEIIYTCKTHFPKNIKKTKLNIFKKKCIKEYLLQDIATVFLEKIQEIHDSDEAFKTVKEILIELQPRINNKAVFTSHILYGKLVELYKEKDTTIKFVRASQKLKAYIGPEIECKLKGAYAKRKFLSVSYTRWFLENRSETGLSDDSNKWLIFFESKKIKPDMADCFLMCINAIVGIPSKRKYAYSTDKVKVLPKKKNFKPSLKKVHS